ncbi:MAG: SIMPL domain-containing protein [Firmicutes bacterium]|nr:SIMPL domain-containing protein [Bacillota bacterium]
MGNIRVTGKSTVRLQPDTTRLTITLKGGYMDYQETLTHSARDTEALREALTALGFARDGLKTLSFDVDTKYENVQEHGRNFRQVFAGYEYTHVLKLDFPSDNDLLGRTLYALAVSELHPEFRLSYTVRDQEGARNLLLAQAVSDARGKARVLAQAAGAELGELQTIDYSWGDVSFEVQPLRRSLAPADGALMAKAASLDLAIEPEEIQLSDTVTVVWALA